MISLIRTHSYHLLSGLKIIIGVIILLSLYLLIDPYSDPGVALGGAMAGIFLAVWGASFFAFRGRKQRSTHPSQLTAIRRHSILTESYQLSLLFGIYCLINVILLLRQSRNPWLGTGLFIAFLVLQSLLVSSSRKE